MATFVGCNRISQVGKPDDLLSGASLHCVMIGFAFPSVGMICDVASLIPPSIGSSNDDVIDTMLHSSIGRQCRVRLTVRIYCLLLGKLPWCCCRLHLTKLLFIARCWA